MSDSKSKIKDQLIRHEGLRLKPYRDTVGKLTIGVGRNLDDIGISKEEALCLLENDLKRVERDLDRAVPYWKDYGDVRAAVLVNMCFNLGITRLLGFRKFLAAFHRGDFQTAANEMLDSKWAIQVGHRAVELANQMRTGQWQ